MEDIINDLQEFGLRRIEIQVYIFLSKKGPKTVNELAEALKLRKSQLYYLLKRLRQQKFIKTSAKRPTTFSATGIETILNLIINSKIKQAEEMEASKKLFLNKRP